MSKKFLLLSVTLLACSTEPSGGAALDADAARDAGPPRDASVDVAAGERAAPLRVDACVKSGAPMPSVGFARHQSGELVAFDPVTARLLARRPLGFEIIDLDWDDRTQRVLLTSTEELDVEGSRVHALSFDGTEFTHEASSEVFPGEVRVVSTPTHVLAIGVEIGSDWYELDDELAQVGKSAALPQPLLVAEPDAVSVLALRREAHADLVYRVSGFAAGWTSAELILPRPAPERGVVMARAGEHAWLLARGDSPDGFEVARLGTAGFPTAASFRSVPGSCGLGAPHSVGVDSSGCSLVTVTGAALDRLAVVPTSPGVTTRCAELGAPLARAAVWVPRNLVIDRAGRRAWVATEDGVESFALEPSIEKLPSFVGTELTAPITLAR